MWDGTNHNLMDIDEDLGFYHGYEPWRTLIQGIKTATAYIKPFNQLSRQTKINRDNIAEALAKKNILRQTRTIQLSSNRKFASVEFHTKEVMELFCTEPLQIGNHYIRFRPDTKFLKPKQKHQLLNISFLNVPTEAPDEALTEFLEQYADIQGKPFYPQKDYQGIPYNTGTRVYQVSKLYQHIPRYIQNMFGRTVKCIYDKQQEYDRVIQFDDSDTEQDNTTHNNRKRNQDNQEYKENNNSSDNESNTTHQNQNQNDEIENETQYQNDETESETESDNESTEENQTLKQQNEKEHTQEKQNNKTAKDMQQQTKQYKTTNNNQDITTRKTNTKTQKHTTINPPPEINFENYPNLISPTNNTANTKTIQAEDDTTVIPETQIPAIIPETQFDEINNANENITQLSLLSPTLVTSNRFNLLQTTPDPLNSSTPEINNRKDQQQQTTKPTPQAEQQNEAKKFARKLLTQEFIDTGYLDNATSAEKEEVIALSMYNMLGPYDPSNSYVQNYGHRKVIEIYKELTEKKATETNILSKLHNILTTINKRIEYKNKIKNKIKHKHKNKTNKY